MDGVLVDFQSGLEKVSEEEKARFADDGTGKPHYDDIPGLFALMDPMPGAFKAVEKLAKKYDVYILSTAPWKIHRHGKTRWNGYRSIFQRLSTND